MRHLEDLLEEARDGTLTDVELEYVANRIKYFDPDKEDDSTLCDLLLIIEESDYQDVISGKRDKPRAIKYRYLIEPYLEYPRWGFVSSVVLRTVCQSTWGFTEDYLDVIRKFIEGVEWDIFDDCAVCSISEAGEYLSKKIDEDLDQKDFELAQLLKSIMDDPTHPLTDCAYRAFARAIGVPWNELFSFPNQVEKESSVNSDCAQKSIEEEK